MQKLAFNYHDKVPTGELMARASSDASQVRLAFAIAPLATANIFLLLILSITLLTLSLPFRSDCDTIYPVGTLASIEFFFKKH